MQEVRQYFERSGSEMKGLAGRAEVRQRDGRSGSEMRGKSVI